MHTCTSSVWNRTELSSTRSWSEYIYRRILRSIFSNFLRIEWSLLFCCVLFIFLLTPPCPAALFPHHFLASRSFSSINFHNEKLIDASFTETRRRDEDSMGTYIRSGGLDEITCPGLEILLSRLTTSNGRAGLGPILASSFHAPASSHLPKIFFLRPSAHVSPN